MLLSNDKNITLHSYEVAHVFEGIGSGGTREEMFAECWDQFVFEAQIHLPELSNEYEHCGVIFPVNWTEPALRNRFDNFKDAFDFLYEHRFNDHIIPYDGVDLTLSIELSDFKQLVKPFAFDHLKEVCEKQHWRLPTKEEASIIVPDDEYDVTWIKHDPHPDSRLHYAYDHKQRKVIEVNRQFKFRTYVLRLDAHEVCKKCFHYQDGKHTLPCQECSRFHTDRFVARDLDGEA